MLNCSKSALGAWLPVAAYAALIFALSSMPSLAPPGDTANLDKVAHLVEFSLMGALLARAIGLSGVGKRGLRLAGAVLLGAAFAAVDEVLQGRMGRKTSLADWAADTVGVVLAAAAVVWLESRSSTRRSRA